MTNFIIAILMTLLKYNLHIKYTPLNCPIYWSLLYNHRVVQPLPLWNSRAFLLHQSEISSHSMYSATLST